MQQRSGRMPPRMSVSSSRPPGLALPCARTICARCPPNPRGVVHSQQFAGAVSEDGGRALSWDGKMLPELAQVLPEASSHSGVWQPSSNGSFVVLALIVSFGADE